MSRPRLSYRRTFRFALHLGPALLVPDTALAQRASQPEYAVSITAGVLRGDRLWSISPQPVWAPSGARDSLALTRRLLQPSLVLRVAATRFASHHVGIGVEASYLGLVSASRCEALSEWATDPDHLNALGCDAVDGRRTSHAALAVQAGLVARSNDGSGSHFFARGSAGVAYLARSLTTLRADVETAASNLVTLERVDLLGERTSAAFTWVASASAGVRVAMGATTNVAVEVGDVLMGLPVPTAAGTVPDPGGAPLAPVAHRVFHFPTLSLSLDVVLNRSRARRY